MHLFIRNFTKNGPFWFVLHMNLSSVEFLINGFLAIQLTEHGWTSFPAAIDLKRTSSHCSSLTHYRRRFWWILYMIRFFCHIT
ncbi:hypothetical protein Hanom_Chr05g00456361 [Helianthus anomalus]